MLKIETRKLNNLKNTLGINSHLLGYGGGLEISCL
jgi:hypothetical protein